MPKCAKRTEVYSRVCGYHRPVALWNRGKKEEFRDRKVFRMTEAKGTAGASSARVA